MSKKKTIQPSSATDFKKVKSIAEKGKLDEVLSKLDPNDIPETIRRVPKELIRFMSHLLVRIEDVDTKTKTLKAEHRIPIELLLESARKHGGDEFAKSFYEKLGTDEKIRREFGFDFRKTKDALEAKLDNFVTEVKTTSQLMLKTRRLYTELAFMQDNSLLLRINGEIDDLLMISSRILYGAKCTLDWLKKNAKGVKPEIYFELCRKQLDEINSDSRYVRTELDKLAKTSVRRKSRRKKIAKNPKARKSTGKT